MALTTGTRLGPYEILSALGAGGMGEVYRAKDTRLHRDVAIKVLPDLFVNDPERLLRNVSLMVMVEALAELARTTLATATAVRTRVRVIRKSHVRLRSTVHANEYCRAT